MGCETDGPHPMSVGADSVACMTHIVVQQATSQRFDDVEHALSGGGDGRACQCQWWLMTGREWDAAGLDRRTELLREQVACAPAPGLVAYVDEVAAGWVRVGPRPSQPRLSRTRSFQASPHTWSEPDVWAVTCFVVRREFRGRGVMSALVDAAAAHAFDNGARVVEAYPIDTAVRQTRVNDLYTGVLSVFLAAGFRETARPAPHRVIVEKEVA